MGGSPEAPPVLVHDLGGGARAGEEPGVEVGQLGNQRPPDDDTRGPGLDGGPRRVEGVHPVQLELRVGDRPRARRAARPGRRQALTAERPPNAARGDGDDESQDGEKGHGDHDGHDEARRPGGVVGALERGLLPGRAEHAAQTVDHELDAQQQRDHGQRRVAGPRGTGAAAGTARAR